MKKLVVLAIALLTFSVSNAQDQAIKANPIGLAFGIANAGYEFSIKDSQTVTISGLYYGISDVNGFGLGAEYRFYFAGEALRGWHAGPAVGFFSLSGSGIYDGVSATAFTIGGEGGHQWILGEHFVVDAFATLGFVTGGSDLGLNNASFGIGASIGYAW